MVPLWFFILETPKEVVGHRTRFLKYQLKTTYIKGFSIFIDLLSYLKSAIFSHSNWWFTYSLSKWLWHSNLVISVYLVMLGKRNLLDRAPLTFNRKTLTISASSQKDCDDVQDQRFSIRMSTDWVFISYSRNFGTRGHSQARTAFLFWFTDLTMFTMKPFGIYFLNWVKLWLDFIVILALCFPFFKTDLIAKCLWLFLIHERIHLIPNSLPKLGLFHFYFSKDGCEWG